MTLLAKTTAQRPNLRTDESGIASFLVTLVLMLVITLIVIGFAQVARRDQREALDDQLSTQAFYAAETGVNLVQSLMQTTPSVDMLTKTGCSKTAAAYPQYYSPGQLANTSTQVSNTCLLVDTAPTSLVYGEVGANSTVIPLQPDTPADYGTGTLAITWNPKSSTDTGTLSACPTTYGSFPTAASGGWGNCPLGVLRLDIVDTTVAGMLTPQNLESQTMTIFAPPTTSAGSRSPIIKREGAATNALTPTVSCSASAKSCTLTIAHVNFAHTNYLRLTSLYKDVAVSSISGLACPPTNPSCGVPSAAVHFIGAQIEVDSTGKAVDVLRRIQVRLDENDQLAPANAVQSTTGVCKLYTTDGSSTVNTSVCP